MRKLKRTTSQMRKQGAKKSRAVVPRSLKGTPNGIHEFIRSDVREFSVRDTGLIIAATASPLGSIQFSADTWIITNGAGGSASYAMTGFPELVALFDLIKLDKVTVTVFNRNDSAPNSGVTSNATVSWESVIDVTDSTVPATRTALTEYGNYQFKTGDAGLISKRKFTPMLRSQIQTAGVTAMYAPENKYFASDGGIPIFYGYKFYTAGSANPGSTVTIKVDYHYLCQKLK